MKMLYTFVILFIITLIIALILINYLDDEDGTHKKIVLILIIINMFFTCRYSTLKSNNVNNLSLVQFIGLKKIENYTDSNILNLQCTSSLVIISSTVASFIFIGPVAAIIANGIVTAIMSNLDM